MILEVLVGVLGTMIASILAWVGHEVVKMRDQVALIGNTLSRIERDVGDHEARIREVERST